MSKLTFSGGIHPPQYKITKSVPIKDTQLPEKVVIPLSQHTGEAAKPLVKKGDYVLRNQKIGEGVGKISAPVHSSISGTVIDCINWNHPVINEPVLSVVIESDGKDDQEIPKKNYEDYYRHSPDEIRNVIHSSGIVGLGGAAFPTHVK
ncbi:MAG: hypothetical protein QME68_08115, partial [Elusimicrobiota bacterium]|nr:hypothetical protein [Elusimicrobiota bacterium]